MLPSRPDGRKGYTKSDRCPGFHSFRARSMSCLRKDLTEPPWAISDQRRILYTHVCLFDPY